MAEKNEPRMGFSFGYDFGEDNWDTGFNSSIKRNGTVLQLSVISWTVTATPVSPTNGDVYIVPASGVSGAWVGQEKDVASYIEGAWEYFTPNEGWMAWVEDEDRHVMFDDASLWNGLQPYDIGVTKGGLPAVSEVLVRYPFPREVIFPSGLTGSQGVAAVAATAQTDFDVLKNGGSVGTIRFAASGTVATFIMATATTFAVGDIMTIIAPGTQDTTLADLGFALTGIR